MSNDLNMCQFIGRAGRDPEVRYMQNGKAVCNVSIAVGRSWKSKEGEKQEETEWVNLVFYDKLAEIVGEHVQKGKQVYAAGRMKTRKWQDKDGADRYTTEVIAETLQLLGGGQREEAPAKPAAKPAGKSAPRGRQQTMSVEDGNDIPF